MVCDVIKPDLTTFIQYECENREGKLIVKVIVQQGTESPYYLGKKAAFGRRLCMAGFFFCSSIEKIDSQDDQSDGRRWIL